MEHKPRVQIESPYKGDTPDKLQVNIEYAKKCLLDSLNRNEAPFASHLLYTQVLDDNKAQERKLWIEAGWTYLLNADKVAVYLDRGLSSWMIGAIQLAENNDIPVEKRYIEK